MRDGCSSHEKAGGDPLNLLLQPSLRPCGDLSLDEAVGHGCIVVSEGASLNDGRAALPPKQALAVQGDAIGILGQGISSVTLGTRPYLQSLHHERVQSAVDRISTHFRHGYSGILDACISHRSFLRVLPGTVEGTLHLVEPLVEVPSHIAAQLFHSVVELFHQGECVLDCGLGIEGCQVHRSVMASLQTARWPWDFFFGHSLKSLLLGDFTNQTLYEFGVSNLEGVPIMIAHVRNEGAELLIVGWPEM